MSFSWSASSNPSFTGLKSAATTNSFADALKRLAEHVEEKNKTNVNNNGTSGAVQSSTDSPNRINLSHANNSILPEQALRLYTQYIQEMERREDMRRYYLRTYTGTDSTNSNLNRRFDTIESCRFMAPHLSSLIHSSLYLQSISQQQQSQLRMPPPPSPSSLSSSFLFPNMKPTDTTSRISALDNLEKKSEQSLKYSKPKSKLFRPYDLDSPTSTSHQLSFSPPSFIPDDLSSGKEKQLLNSLGLVQQSTDVLSEKTSFTETSASITISDDSPSIETNSEQQNKSSSPSPRPVKFKRKSFSSARKSTHRKQAKIDSENN